MGCTSDLCTAVTNRLTQKKYTKHSIHFLIALFCFGFVSIEVRYIQKKVVFSKCQQQKTTTATAALTSNEIFILLLKSSTVKDRFVAD